MSTNVVKIMRLFFAIVVILCVLQIFSLLRSVTPTIEGTIQALISDSMTTTVNRSLLLQQLQQKARLRSTNIASDRTNNEEENEENQYLFVASAERQQQQSSHVEDLEAVLADPIVAQAVSDYYKRQKLEANNGIKNGESVPYYQTHPIFKEEQNRIDAIPTTELCHSFGVDPLSQEQLERLPHHPVDDKQQQRGRRIFFGSLIANESWEMIEAHAIEVQDLYHVIAFVESNTTQNRSPRLLRYGPGSEKRTQLQESGLFGNSTKVMMGQWLYNWPDLRELDREVEQRNKVVDLWIEAGMTRDDVGILADLDEIVARDFLRAIRLCDFPKLRRQYEDENPPSCKLPKIVLSSVQFEGSPGCIKKDSWYHPDVILGQCLEGVGDPTGRAVPVRQHKRQYGIRRNEWGRHSLDDYPPDIMNFSTGLFPLFSGRDIRTVIGTHDRLSNYAETPGQGVDAAWGTAFHLHNWFEGNDMATLRHKYLTYGHPNFLAAKAPLWMLDEDIDILVRCAYGMPNDFDPKERVEYLVPPSRNVTLGGNRPIYFLNTTYVEERHRLIQDMVRQDEAKYGPSYNSSGRIKFEFHD
mmetsp:Transcript_56957/g.138757  ORF Transcript_56957/g.138757 Transcript_56957/m.138757 type:complete len:582 (-) Transcript_56957:722-2467(-)